MAEYSLITSTPVPVGEAVPFNNTIIKGCCCIRHRQGSGVVRIKGGTCCKPNIYHVQFHANVTGVTGVFRLGIYLDGELLPETVMNETLATATDTVSVDSFAEIAVDGCISNISVRNMLGTGLTASSALLSVHKEVA